MKKTKATTHKTTCILSSHASAPKPSASGPEDAIATAYKFKYTEN